MSVTQIVDGHGPMHQLLKASPLKFPQTLFHACRAAYPAGKYFITAGVAPSNVRTVPAVTLGKQNQAHLKSFHRPRLFKAARSVAAITPHICSAKMLNSSAK